jgi:hypothetical protein
MYLTIMYNQSGICGRGQEIQSFHQFLPKLVLLGKNEGNLWTVSQNLFF